MQLRVGQTHVPGAPVEVEIEHHLPRCQLYGIMCHSEKPSLYSSVWCIWYKVSVWYRVNIETSMKFPKLWPYGLGCFLELSCSSDWVWAQPLAILLILVFHIVSSHCCPVLIRYVLINFGPLQVCCRQSWEPCQCAKLSHHCRCSQ